ncbi:PREDICTED: succinate--hydroxymethylglutarate CoA-transferase-like [Acropora digitifera]|uniref:succinate--hydroxymethylglutarate CoA-transferase-like n=1 Tax=Acropora digitifera TaxID=70779 RepID=UPI00077AD317|nr:PREDICTED: succinate--hydroxymethylglutarate CoA-transferase-like [Acropora digitifera]
MFGKKFFRCILPFENYLFKNIKCIGCRHVITGPLSGMRVLDMSRVLAGPFATMLLGDLGAEVIKVENPGTVQMKSFFLHQLAEKCDVLVENYVPGKLDKLGLGYDSLKIATPSLIYCSITGYGQGGPYGHKPGYDVIVSGIGGLMHITGPEDGSPCKVGVAVTDLTTGLFAQGSIMAALIQRQKTGKGQKIECSLLASQVAMLSHIASSYLNAGFETGRYGTAHHSIVPYQAFKSSNGYFLVGAGNDGLFKKLCNLLGLDGLADTPLYITNADRVKNRLQLLAILEKRFAERTTEEWIDIFDGSGIPCGPINDIKRVFEDPQVKYKDMVQELDHPTAGSIRLAGPAVEYDGQTCQGIATPPPMLGQHTNDVLRDILGYDRKDILKMEDEEVVKCY